MASNLKSRTKKLLKFFAIVATIVIVITVVALFTVTYKAIDALTSHEKSPSQSQVARVTALVDPTHKKDDGPHTSPPPEQTPATTEGKKKWTQEEFAAFIFNTGKLETIENEFSEKDKPDICQNLCNESHFNVQDKHGPDLLAAIDEFYQREGLRAFDDPRFAISYEMAQTMIVKMLPESTRQFLLAIQEMKNRKEEPSAIEKAQLAAWAQKHILATIYTIQKKLPENKLRLRYLSQMGDLRKQCPEESRSEIYKKCQDMGYSF